MAARLALAPKAAQDRLCERLTAKGPEARARAQLSRSSAVSTLPYGAPPEQARSTGGHVEGARIDTPAGLRKLADELEDLPRSMFAIAVDETWETNRVAERSAWLRRGSMLSGYWPLIRYRCIDHPKRRGSGGGNSEARSRCGGNG